MTAFATFVLLFINGIWIGGVYALIALGLVIIYKATRVINFAYGGMACMGAFILWTCLSTFGLPVWAGVIITIAAGLAIGLIIERLTMRPLIGQPHMASVLVTIALLSGFRGLMFAIWGPNQRSFPVEVVPRGAWQFMGITVSQTLFWSFVASAFLILLLVLYFRYTRSGLAMRVTSEDHNVAESLGVRVKSVFSISWAIAGVVTTVGGIFLASLTQVSVYMDTVALVGIAVLLLGGLESIPGVIVAGIVVGVTQSLASGYLASYLGGSVGEVFPYMLMIIVLITRPYGLFGEIKIERI